MSDRSQNPKTHVPGDSYYLPSERRFLRKHAINELSDVKQSEVIQFWAAAEYYPAIGGTIPESNLSHSVSANIHRIVLEEFGGRVSIDVMRRASEQLNEQSSDWIKRDYEIRKKLIHEFNQDLFYTAISEIQENLRDARSRFPQDQQALNRIIFRSVPRHSRTEDWVFTWRFNKIDRYRTIVKLEDGSLTASTSNTIDSRTSVIHKPLEDFEPDFAKSLVQEWVDSVNGLSKIALPLPSDMPPQHHRALMFGAEAGKPLGLVEPAGSNLLNDESQLHGQAEILDHAKQLQELCRDKPNRLAALSSAVAALLKAFDASLDTVQPRILWAKINGIRSKAEADTRVRGQSDPETPPLPEAVASELQALVNALNLFAALDPILSDLDYLSKDPADREVAAETIASAKALAAAARRSPDIAKPEAADVLTDIINGADTPGPSAARSEQLGTRSASNLGLEIIRKAVSAAYDEAKHAVKEVKSGLYRAVGGNLFERFVKDNADHLISLMMQFEAKDALIAIIKQIIGHL